PQAFAPGKCCVVSYEPRALLGGSRTAKRLEEVALKMLVPEVGLEPTCPCERQILSLVRIPISPLRQRESRGKIIRRMLQESQPDAIGIVLLLRCWQCLVYEALPATQS